MRLLTVLTGIVILAAVAVAVLTLPRGSVDPRSATEAATPEETGAASPSPTASEFTDPCGTFDTQVRTPYAITGYWLVPTSDPCTWRSQLEAIHRVGGDTVVRIGHGLQPRRVDDEGRILDYKGEEVDPRYEPCVEDGLTCVQAAERDLRAANPGNRITWTYVYRTDEAFGPALMRCRSMEHTITVGRTVYYRLIAPDDGSDDPSCDFSSKGLGYHVILIAAKSEDSLTELLDVADRFGIQVFPALPLAPRDRSQSTFADPRHIGTLTTLTRRILQDYGARFAGRVSLGGVYQPFELQMRKMGDDHPTLKVYADQHEIVEQELPGKPILVSPYLDARRGVSFGASPKQVAEGFKALVRTGVGIIAPQDSRGTGKVPLYWPDERDEPVDERLRPIVGETSYGAAYHGSTRDYYRAMAAARAEMVEQGHQVQLWANVEAFEPAADTRCAAQSTRGRTDKARLDAAVAMTGRYVSKVISYMWSDFYTCGSPSLSEEIATDWERPIAVDAIRKGREIQDGIEIGGYRLAGARVTVSWEGLETPKTMDSGAVGWHDPGPLPEEPVGLETVWVPFDWTQVPADTWVRVEVSGADGRAAAEPIHVRINV